MVTAPRPSQICVHTKCVPDLDKLDRLTRPMLRETMTHSAARLGVERLDLVQCHRWDRASGDWLQVAHWLRAFQDEELINLLSSTNFDNDHVVPMLDAGIWHAALQTQYSLLDHRPEKRVAALARDRGMQFLCYGTVAGGFLSDRWLDQPSPQGQMEIRSLAKLLLIIQDFGAWDLFQRLLRTLRNIADCRIATTPPLLSPLFGPARRSRASSSAQAPAITWMPTCASVRWVWIPVTWRRSTPFWAAPGSWMAMPMNWNATATGGTVRSRKTSSTKIRPELLILPAIRAFPNRSILE